LDFGLQYMNASTILWSQDKTVFFCLISLWWWLVLILQKSLHIFLEVFRIFFLSFLSIFSFLYKFSSYFLEVLYSLNFDKFSTPCFLAYLNLFLLQLQLFGLLWASSCFLLIQLLNYQLQVLSFTLLSMVLHWEL
jgi:hypothetical protein